MEDIIPKIRDIYARYGIRSITMGDLASELGISKKTLYQLFTDKEEVVRKVVEFMIHDQQRYIAGIKNNNATNAIDELLQMSRYISEHLKSVNPSFAYDLRKYYPPVWSNHVQFKSKTILEHIMANIRKGIAEGLYRKDLNYDILAFVFVSRMELYSPGGFPELEKFSYHEVFLTIFQYHVRGIANENGRKYLEELLAGNEIEK